VKKTSRLKKGSSSFPLPLFLYMYSNPLKTENLTGHNSAQIHFAETRLHLTTRSRGSTIE